VTAGTTVPSATVRFYFDFISPNAYMAWTQLPALAAKHGFAVDAVPVLYAGLLEAHGGIGPAEVPLKGLWMFKNNVRKAALLGVPFHPPAYHPFNPLLALRVASLPLDDVTLLGLRDSLFRAVWARGLHVSEPVVVERVLDELGLDGRSIVEEAGCPESKARLRRQTDDAIGRGVFGVPSMEVGGEIFWGYDDFPYLERRLAGRELLDPEVWRAWSGGPRPSAVRRRFRPGGDGASGAP
jgi:2-hydroxychromene-2-carboxylate isomerase